MHNITRTLLRARRTSQIASVVTRSWSRHFSNQQPLFVQNNSKSTNTRDERQSQNLNNGNPSYPAFSFEALGLSRNMKVFLIVILSIFGTLETWFYCKAVWHWWKGGSDVEAN